MHRIDTQGHKQNRFSDGNPTDTTGETGTVIDSSWLNAVQEEICGVIEGFGGKLGKGRELEGQMADVLQKAFLDLEGRIVLKISVERNLREKSEAKTKDIFDALSERTTSQGHFKNWAQEQIEDLRQHKKLIDMNINAIWKRLNETKQ